MLLSTSGHWRRSVTYMKQCLKKISLTSGSGESKLGRAERELWKHHSKSQHNGVIWVMTVGKRECESWDNLLRHFLQPSPGRGTLASNENRFPANGEFHDTAPVSYLRILIRDTQKILFTTEKVDRNQKQDEIWPLNTCRLLPCGCTSKNRSGFNEKSADLNNHADSVKEESGCELDALDGS